MMYRWRVYIPILVLCVGLSSMAVAQGTGHDITQATARETGQGTPQGASRPAAGPPPLSSRPPQGFAFKWWQDARFKTELSLTPDQCKRAEGVYQGVLPRMTADKEDVDRLEERLSEVIAAGVLPENDVVKLIDQVETARAQLGKVRTLMTYRLRQMLTPDQRAKIKAMHDSWEKERRQGPVRKRPEGMPREGGLL
jgi:Spy/CpxP family protein refolding chaperone